MTRPKKKKALKVKRRKRSCEVEEVRFRVRLKGSRIVGVFLDEVFIDTVERTP